MTVSPTGYIRRYPAWKQESQSFTVDQSARVTENILKDFCKFEVTI